MPRRKKPTPRLKMYTAYVDFPHIRWAGWSQYDDDASGFAIDRLNFPVIASSIGHAKKLAEKAWGRGGLGRVLVSYIGPCIEPGARR